MTANSGNNALNHSVIGLCECDSACEEGKHSSTSYVRGAIMATTGMWGGVSGIPPHRGGVLRKFLNFSFERRVTTAKNVYRRTNSTPSD